MTKEKMIKSFKCPWGIWEIHAGITLWRHNPALEMSEREQFDDNVKNGFLCEHGRLPHMCNDKHFTSAVTISATPQCPHSNGWDNSIPARFWGRRRVFVCTDCGDILEPIGKKERV